MRVTDEGGTRASGGNVLALGGQQPWSSIERGKGMKVRRRVLVGEWKRVGLL